MVKDAATAARFKHLVDKDGKWTVGDDVWIPYLDRKGPLTLSFIHISNGDAPSPA